MRAATAASLRARASCAAAQMPSVQVDDRVAKRAREPGCPDRAERGAVLDSPLLLAVPPDEVRNVMDVWVPARRDRGEAHGCQRRERRGRACVRAVLEQ